VLAWSAVLPVALLDAGEPERAAEAFAAIADGDFAAVPDGLLWLPATAWLAEAAARLEDMVVCAGLYTRLAPHSGRLVQAGFTGCWGAVDRVLGMVAGVLGRHEEARRHLDAALDRHLAIDAGPLARRTRIDRERLGSAPAVR
jgi:hypothetical protein